MVVFFYPSGQSMPLRQITLGLVTDSHNSVVLHHPVLRRFPVSLWHPSNLPPVDAVEMTFGSNIDYAQVVKLFASVNPGPGRYSPPRVAEVVSTTIIGNPDEQHISTSYVEAQNLTMRQAIRRFTRLTTGYSKKLENLKAAVALWFCYYNFCRVHGSLRVTPAMQAEITDTVWTLDCLVT